MENKNLMTASEVIVNSGLNFEVVGTKIYDVNGKELSNYKAIQRGDNGHTFQVAKKGYAIIQNHEALSIMDEVVESGMAKYDKAHVYKNGAVMSVRVEVPFSYDVVGDEIKTYLNVSTSHDSTLPTCIDLYQYRLVCLNGMMGMKKTQSSRFRHTINYKMKIEDAKKMFEEYKIIFNQQKEIYTEMARHQMNSLTVDTFLNELLNIKNVEEVATKTLNQKELIENLFAYGKGNSRSGVAGTKWAAFNAVTEYVDHHRSTKGDESNREYSSIYGSGATMKEKAFALLTK